MNNRSQKNNDEIIINIEEKPYKYDLEHMLPVHMDLVASYLVYDPDLIHLRRVSKKMKGLVDETGANKLAKEIEEQIYIYQQFHPLFNKMLSSFKLTCWLVERFTFLTVVGGGSSLLLTILVMELLRKTNASFNMTTGDIPSIFFGGAMFTNSVFFAKKIYDRYGLFKQGEQVLLKEMRESLKFPILPLYASKHEEDRNDHEDIGEGEYELGTEDESRARLSMS
jgi:hypothetical protein